MELAGKCAGLWWLMFLLLGKLSPSQVGAQTDGAGGQSLVDPSYTLYALTDQVVQVDLAQLLEQLPPGNPVRQGLWTLVDDGGLGAQMQFVPQLNLLGFSLIEAGTYQVQLAVEDTTTGLRQETALQIEVNPPLQINPPAETGLLRAGRDDRLDLTAFLAGGRTGEHLRWEVLQVSDPTMAATIVDNQLQLQPQDEGLGTVQVVVAAIDTFFAAVGGPQPPGVEVLGTAAPLRAEATLAFEVYPGDLVQGDTLRIIGFENQPLSQSLNAFLKPHLVDWMPAEARWAFVSSVPNAVPDSLSLPGLALALSGDVLAVAPEVEYDGMVEFGVEVNIPVEAPLDLAQVVPVQLDLLPLPDIQLAQVQMLSGTQRQIDLNDQVGDRPLGVPLSWSILPPGPVSSLVGVEVRDSLLVLDVDPGFVGEERVVLRLSAPPPDDRYPADSLVVVQPVRLIVDAGFVREPEIVLDDGQVRGDTLIFQPLFEDYPAVLSLGALLDDDDPASVVDWQVVTHPQMAGQVLSDRVSLELMPATDYFGAVDLGLIATDTQGNADTTVALINVLPVVDLELEVVDPLVVAMNGSAGLELSNFVEELGIYDLGYRVDPDRLSQRLNLSVNRSTGSLGLAPQLANWWGEEKVYLQVFNRQVPGEAGYVDTDSLQIRVEPLYDGEPFGAVTDSVWLIGPGDGTKVEAGDLELQWFPLAGNQVRYFAEVSADSSFDQDVQQYPILTSQLAGIGASFVSDQLYWWRVVALVEDAFHVSAVDSFQVGRRPDPFELAAPLWGAVVRQERREFSWVRATDPEGAFLTYQFELAQNDSFANAQVFELPAALPVEAGEDPDQVAALWQVQDTLRFEVPVDLAEETYYWRVTATDPDGFSSTANLDSFEVHLFEALAPADSSMGLNPLQWSRYLPDMADRGLPLEYQLRFSNLAQIGDTTLVLPPGIQSETEQYLILDAQLRNTLSTPTPSGEQPWISWQVAAVLDGQVMALTAPRHFLPLPGPGGPGVELLAPSPDSTVAMAGLSLHWMARPEPDALYTLRLTPVLPGNEVADTLYLRTNDPSVDMNDSRLAQYVLAEQWYEWTVQATADDTVYTAAAPWRFYLSQGPDPFALVGPVGGLVVADSRPTLSWERSSDPDGRALNYHLQVARDSIFSTLLLDRKIDSGDPMWTSVNDQVLPFAFGEEDSLTNGEYYWRVTAAEATGLAQEGQGEGRFWINIFEVVGPEEGFLLDGRLPRFQWTRYLPEGGVFSPAAPPAAQRYRLVIQVPDLFVRLNGDLASRLSNDGLNYPFLDPNSPPRFDPGAGQLIIDLLHPPDPTVEFWLDDGYLEQRLRQGRGPYQWQVFALDGAQTVAAGEARTFYVSGDPLINFVSAPNPFRIGQESAAFRFALARPASAVELVVYDMMGQALRAIRQEGRFEGGETHAVNWSGVDQYGESIGVGVYAAEIYVHWEDEGVSRLFTKVAVIP